jgi:class 3 adenylate cyclase
VFWSGFMPSVRDQVNLVLIGRNRQIQNCLPWHSGPYRRTHVSRDQAPSRLGPSAFEESASVADTQSLTFVFTDLVGSTAQASRLDPDVAIQLAKTHFGLLRGAIAAHGGTEVKNLGDGLMVVFAVSSGALNCAEAMQQAMELHNRRAPEPLLIRVGISHGFSGRTPLARGQSKLDVLTVLCGPSTITAGSVRAVFGTVLAGSIPDVRRAA